MYTISDLYDIAYLYYTQAIMSFLVELTESELRYLSHDMAILPSHDSIYSNHPDNKPLYALRSLLYTIAANMIYEGRY